MASGGDGSETLYATLGVSSTVTAEDVRKVYRKLVLKCHPDKASTAHNRIGGTCMVFG